MTDDSHNNSVSETDENAVTDTEVTPDDSVSAGDSTDADTGEPAGDADTFPRSYVEELRQENGKHRQRARELGERLHVELVRATGLLADPTDLPFDADHLDNPDKLAEAIDALLAAKPHLKARRVTGSVGQGESGKSTSVSLIDLMRS